MTAIVRVVNNQIVVSAATAGALAAILLPQVALAQTAQGLSEDARDISVAAKVEAVDAAADALAAAEASGDVTFFDTKADADAALGGLAEDDVVEVFADEDEDANRTRYRVESGALVLKANLSSSQYVSFASAGSGALTRSLQAVLRDLPLTPEGYEAAGDGTTDDSAELANMLTALAATEGKRAVISRPHLTTATLVVPARATIEFTGAGKIKYTGTGNALDCSAGGFHLIAPHIEGPWTWGGTAGSSSAGEKTGIWISGTYNGAGVAPTYVEGGHIERPHIYGFERSLIETRLWANGEVTSPLLYSGGYAGVMNQSARGFRGRGPGLIYNIGPHTSGNAYGHSENRRTDGVYATDGIASPRATNSRVWNWTFRNIPWNGPDTHGGDDCIWYDCVIEECPFEVGMVGSGGVFGVQRSGHIRTIIRNDPDGAVYALVRSGSSTGINGSIVVQGVASDPARDCFVIDPYLEYTGEDVSGSGGIVLENTENCVVRGVRGRGVARHLVSVRGGSTSNANFLVEDVVSIDGGSDNSVGSYVVFVDSAGGSTGIVRGARAETTADFDFSNPHLAVAYGGNIATNSVEISGLTSDGSVALLAGTGVGIKTPPAMIITDGARVGGTAGWVAPTINNPGLSNLPASQAAAKLVVPISGLRTGDIIQGFHLIGQIESAGGAVTLDADLRRATVAASEPTYASVGAITQLAVTADTAVSSANAAKTGLSQTVGADQTFAVVLTGTTAAATDIIIMGVAIQFIRPG